MTSKESFSFGDIKGNTFDPFNFMQVYICSCVWNYFKYFRESKFYCGKAEIQLKIKILSIDSCLEIKGSYSSEYLRATDDRFVILIDKFCENLIWYVPKLFSLLH